ncbi:MAG: histidine phosphatase family protein [Candidatus Brachytrichaceae bacterium NZ_4S206]|jgi:broad specificity phosphatase PhoE
MTHLWLIRHGQTDWNVQGRWQGQTPDAPPLNATGVAQAHALAETLAQQAEQAAFQALYSSDLLRARQTAEIIGLHLRLPVRLDPRLREVNLGVWEGMLGEEVALRYVAELEERKRNPVYSRPPQGETVFELAARVGRALDDIARAHPSGDVIVVSHGLAIATALCMANGTPLERVFDHLPDNAALHVIAWRI